MMRFQSLVSKLRSRRAMGSVLVLAAAMLANREIVFALGTYINDTFANSTDTGNYITGVGNTGSATPALPACLTAGTSTTGASPAGCTTTRNPNNGGNSGSIPDASGSGALRLTDDENNESSFLIINTPVPTSGGVQATFDIFAYGGQTTNADGIGFLILDGTAAAPTTAGAAGGSFGYAQKSGTGATDAPGIVGGYIGIGFDEYGNYSNPTEGRVGGVAKEPESVGIRGSAATNYNFIKFASVAPNSIDVPTSKTRPTARNVKVTLSPAGILEVDIDFTGTSSNYTQVIAPFNVTTAIANQGALPSSLRFGFSASTGGFINFHEIRNFKALATVAPTLAITKTHTTSPFKANGTGAYTLHVSDSASAGPTDNNVYITDTLPVGETFVSAAGTNWSCVATLPPGNTQQLVTCTYTATINAGTSPPDVTLTVNVLPNAPASITNSATVNTSDNTVAAGATASDTVAVTQTALLQLYKRITAILTFGPTPGPTTTARAVTIPNDASNLTGVTGTATNQAVYPGDTVTYAIYYLNVGGINATMTPTATTVGPVFNDPLNAALTYVANSQTTTCCTNPTATSTSTFTQTTAGTPAVTTLSWALQKPLAPATTTTAIQGSITFQTKVK